MEMERKEDFSLGDESQELCKYCTDETGKLLPFEQIVKVNTDYYIDSQGITVEAATKMATDMLMAQPAWRNS